MSAWSVAAAQSSNEDRLDGLQVAWVWVGTLTGQGVQVPLDWDGASWIGMGCILGTVAPSFGVCW